MARKSREKAGLIVRRNADGRLAPVSAFDAETLGRFPAGTEFNVTSRTRRSSQQNRLYWETLGRVVQATGRYPTSEHLHRAIKQTLGYVTVNYTLDGKPFVEVDSVGFDAMGQEDYQTFFDAAMKLLADLIGSDPLAFYAEAA